jgi:hypothetical protein
LHIILSIADIIEYDPANIKVKPTKTGMLINIEPNRRTFPINFAFLSPSFLINEISSKIETRMGM